MSARAIAIVIVVIVGLSTATVTTARAKGRVFCTTMLSGSFHISSCHGGEKVRTDLSRIVEGKKQLLSSWIIDAKRGWNWMVDHRSKTYRSASLSSGARELRQQNAKGFAEAVQRQQKMNAALAAVKTSPGRSRWNSGAKGSCASWYRFSDVVIGAQKRALGDLCIRRWPRRSVSSYMSLVALLKRARKKMKPLELQGLPMPNLVLPIYLADGVIRPDHLPVIYATSTAPRQKRFSYHYRTVSQRHFTPPSGFKKK